MPRHVMRHCEGVANFALKLGKKLIAAGEKIDLDLLYQASMVHDLVRVVDFRHFRPEKFSGGFTQRDLEVWEALRKKYAGMHHADAGAKILEERGFIEIAQIVRAHRFTHIDAGFGSWEEKILYYADKRVKHDQIVTLEERLHDGRIRNAHMIHRTEEGVPASGDINCLASLRLGLEESGILNRKVFELEKEIFEKIGEIVF